MQLVFGQPIMTGVWPPDLSRELANAAAAAVAQNQAAIGSGFGGARNRLANLRPYTVKKKGHDRQILESGTMRGAITMSAGADEATAFVGDATEPRGKSSPEVAKQLITGIYTDGPSYNDFRFFGISTGAFETFMIAIQDSYARQIGARTLGWPRLGGASNVPGGVADPADGTYEIDIGMTGSAALRRA
jgi:hypothetical protein